MKKLFFIVAILPVLFYSCSSLEEQDDIIIPQSTKELRAGFAEDTRTYIENDKLLRWHEDDRLTVFYGNTLNDQYKFKGKTGDNSGTFALIPSGELGTGNTLPNIYAIYPYNADAKISDNGIITYSFPAIQNYAENSFAKNANTMVAVTNGISDTFLSFRNVCGFLKLKLYGDATIKSIEVKGNFGEKIAGASTITAIYGAAPSFTMNSDATDTIIINCGEGVTLGTTANEATIFWVVIPATTFKYGITITATSIDNKVFTKSTSNSVVIERNTPLPMSALEFIGESNEISPIATSAITYTTDDGNIVDLFTTEGFGANYVSNVYDTENNIGTITFDGEITTIPAEAFLVCTNLTSVQIPNSVTTIAEKAFYGCNYMEKIIIPESIDTITETAFEGCSGEVHIFCNINDRAFVGSLFTKVVMSDSVTSIGKESFMDCVELKDIILSNSLISLPYYAFQNTNIETIIIPEGIVSIDEGVFYQCAKLKYISLPESVDILGPAAFADCSSLTEIKMPTNMVSIGSEAFLNCTSLIECTIPEGVTDIKDKLFHNCPNLTTLSLPSTITSLAGAFYGCKKLTRLNLADINAWLRLEPTNPTGFLGGECPFGASDMGDIYINGELLTDLVIPNNITTIYGSAFRKVTSLKSVTFGSRVTTIGNYAFDGCYNIENLTFSKSLSIIGNGAFRRTGISEITITKNIANNSSGASIFAACAKLSKVYIEEDVTILPPWLFGDAVGGCSSLKSITIPSSVTTINKGVFAGCTNLSKVIFNGTTPPSMHFSSIFRDKNSTAAYAYIPPTIYVPEGYYDTYMNSDWDIYLKNIISKDGNPVYFTIEYESSEKIEPIDYTSWSTEVASYIVKNEFNDEKGCLYFSNQLNYIPQSGFSGETTLKRIQLPQTIVSIKNRAFANCFELSEIVIPANVTNIGDAAFYFTDSLTKVYMQPITPPAIGDGIFEGNKNFDNFTIYVPRDSVEEYKNATGWSDYADYIVGYDF
ncbi:MAG: leucine-rich repeat protein [Alistipes sp.]|nr:leucine-rich repeat protein [Alistipes sp.]